jgi:hypothetical protein
MMQPLYRVGCRVAPNARLYTLWGFWVTVSVAAWARRNE